MITYGQLVNGKRIAFSEFQNEVLKTLKQFGINNFNLLSIKKQYNKGVSIDDTISYLILNSK